MEGELRNDGSHLFLLPIQDCRTKVIGNIPQMPTKTNLGYYKTWLTCRLRAGMDEKKKEEIVAYLCIPWIRQDRRDARHNQPTKTSLEDSSRGDLDKTH